MKKNQKNAMSLRPPIVVVLGHVDHGKTTLLDSIRKTSVAVKEAGGITQSIGASQVKTLDGKTITFIDTPGHAAFSSMRARGAKIADIAILVVAADDGMKPQTKEALEYILAEDMPFIIAATKIDLQTASSETVITQLEKEGVSFEGRGGNVPLVKVSGKTGQGVDELLEIINLLAELHEIKGDPEGPMDALVIETARGKSGLSVSLVVKNGTLKVGDEVITENAYGKVKGLFDYLGKSVDKVEPGEPSQILGFTESPEVGSKVWVKNQKEALPAILTHRQLQQVTDNDKIMILIKAKNAGALEAVIAHIPPEFYCISSGVGEITETDIFLAKSANANIYAFESKASSGILKLAKTEGVKVETFTIIYKLFEKLQEEIVKRQIVILGRAQILNFFPFNNKKVAGCKVIDGKITKDDKVTLTRNEKPLGTARMSSMKKGRQDVAQVIQGEEFGVILAPQLEFKVGDMLLSVREKKIDL